MLNDREDKYEGQDDSEYHFSDDEVSYQVEPPEPQKPSPNKESFMNRLTRSKRMVISIVVFLVLVFTVYKMVAPTSPDVANTNIAAAPAVVQPPVATTAPASVPTSPNTASSGVIAVNPPPANVPPPQQPMTQVAPPVQTAQAPIQPPVQQPPQQVTSPAPTMVQAPPTTGTVQTTTVVTQPSVAMSSTPPNTNPATMPPPPTAAPPAGTAPMATDMSAGVSAESDRLANQLQNEYAQRVNDYAAQNKALQDQVQTLNARVAGMETQLNQLVQALTRQNQAAQNTPPPEAAPAAPVAADSHVAYNVQAIIPGRAWLRSDNGETVTVAEGDVIRDLGRITKIDPYDGIVEINTGSKTIALSYGNGS